MRYLALDLGNRRIGMATGGVPGVPVVPVGHLERKTLRHDLDRVLAIARERDAAAIVVGIPYSLSGEAAGQAKLAQGFVRELVKLTEMPVFTVDERFTSVWRRRNCSAKRERSRPGTGAKWMRRRRC